MFQKNNPLLLLKIDHIFGIMLIQKIAFKAEVNYFLSLSFSGSLS